MKSEIDKDFSNVEELVEKLRGCTITESLHLSFQLCCVSEKLLLANLDKALDAKIEQTLWESAVKKQVTFFQHKINVGDYTNQEHIVAKLNTILDYTSGFYIKLLQKISETFEVSIPCRNNISNMGLFYDQKPRAIMEPAKPASVLYICQHCVMHLGDIARYRSLPNQAQNYYQNACQILPHNGQPYNQLAILECSLGCKLNAVHRYIQALTVSHPFNSARVNLDKIFRKVSKDTRIELAGKIYVNDVKQIFVKLTALLCLQLDIEKTRQLLSRVLTAFTAHLSTTFPKQFEVITLAVYTYGTTHSKLQEQETRMYHVLSQFYDCTVQLIVGIFEALIQAAPRQENKLKQSTNICSIKIILNWLFEQEIRKATSIINHKYLENASIWQSLCKMLNTLGQNYNPSIVDDSDVPLSEDVHFRYFNPFNRVFMSLTFSNEPFYKDENECDIRVHRLLCLAKSFADKYQDKHFYQYQIINGKIQFIIRPNKEITTTKKKVSKRYEADVVRKSTSIFEPKNADYSLFGQGQWDPAICNPNN